MDREPTPLTDADIEAMVRRYVAKMARRYLPVVAALVAFGLIIALVPTVNKDSGTTAAGFTAGGTSGRRAQKSASPGTGGADLATAGDTGSATTAPAGDAGAAGASSAGDTGSGGSGEIAAVQEGQGTARSGVACGKGVLQVPWTPYAPPCVGAFSGDNGGKTSYGVTADAINVSFRRTNSAEEKAAFAAMGDAAPGTDDQYLADLRTYVDFFNKNYELYGRKVVIKDFKGQGDNLEEDQGRQLEGAQADASTAKDIGAFIDMSQSPTLASTQPYEEALAQQKIVTIGGLGLPHSWFEKFAPYEYSLAPDGTAAGTGAANALCARAWDMPAIYAGDATYTKQNRKFGLITPENPVYMQLGDELLAAFKKGCGGSVAKRVSYAINIATMAQQSVSVIGQMRAAGVTTVICVCDPVVEVTISQAADNQRYYPEWFATAWGDPQARQLAQNEWKHAIAGASQALPKAQDEAYKVFKMANPKAEPAEQYFGVAYWQVVYLFNLLQRSGPQLNPQTFQRAAFTMPTTARGQLGVLGGGEGAYSPAKEAQIGYWSPDATSNFDGKKGGWLNCEGGKWIPFDDPSQWGPRKQFGCFGR